MAYVISGWQLVIGIAGFIAIIILVVGLFFFGKLIKHKAKLSLLAKRGYTQIRHIKEDMTEKYYFLRIRNDHYDFDDGIYMEQRDTRTKTGHILAPLDYDLLSNKLDINLNAEEREIKSFLRGIRNSQVMDITTLSWGIPTITYYGNNPNPINPKEIHKVYDAKNIASMVKRLLLTKEWKLVKMVLYLCMCSIILSLILGFINYGVAHSNAVNLANCLSNWNSTQVKYEDLLNASRVVLQNSTTII
jgi:hypothetical protein